MSGPVEPRTTVVFASDVFNTTEERSYYLNPSCFGDDVARWLMSALRARGISTDDEPGQEDFGWYFRYHVGGVEHCFVVGYQPGDTSSGGVWIGTVERQRGLLASLLARRNAGVLQAATRAIHEALSTSPDITAFSWHSQSTRDPTLDSGARTPD